MATMTATSPAKVWGTFEDVRDRLFEQFRDVPWRSETGIPVAELRQEVDDYLHAHSDQPRVLQRAHVYRIVTTRGQIAVDPEDWFADKLNHGNLLRDLRDGWYREAKATTLETEAGWFDRVYRRGVVRGLLDHGHISPGWENLFSVGLNGLIEQARRERERWGADATPEQVAFWEAVGIVYRATIELALRFARLAETMAAERPEHAPRLRAIAAACRQVPAGPPRTFYEALQFSWLMHERIEMEGEAVRSMGHFDRLFYPYYRADVDAGRVTPDQARELIQFLYMKYFSRTRGKHNGKNFVFGGQHPDGSDATNELTFIALDAYERLNAPDPKLSVRFFPGTPDRLYRRVADLVRGGLNSFVLMNDDPAVAALVKRGKTLEDARKYLPIGCYEPAVDGKEAACTMNLIVNLAKGVELALYDGRDPLSGEQIGPRTGDPRQFTTFEQLHAAYTAQMDFVLTRSAEYLRAHERQWPAVNPSPLIAGSIDDCLARGKDIGEGGARYNAVGCVGVALANACDSLLALKRAVFEEKRFTMAQVLDALAADFEGEEMLRQYLANRAPKWGNEDPEADALARQIADWYCAKIHTFRSARGGPFQAALFSFTFQWEFGRNTGALPDGRRARTPLAPGVGAGAGRDRSGVAGLLGSAAKLDFTETPNGSVLDVMLHPSAVAGPEGLDAFVALIRGFFARGGYALQFNVVDTETLREAQRHPERYATLQVRVTGYSAYFTTLSKYEQDHLIAQTAHGNA